MRHTTKNQIFQIFMPRKKSTFHAKHFFFFHQTVCAWRLFPYQKQSHNHQIAHPSSHITSNQRQTNRNNRRSLACLNLKSPYEKTCLSVSRPQKNLKMRNTTKHEFFGHFILLPSFFFPFFCIVNVLWCSIGVCLYIL